MVGTKQMNIKARRLWRTQFQQLTYQLLSVLLLHKAAICQSWLKRRQGCRYQCRINAAIRCDNRLSNTVIRDISSHGARIEGQHGLNAGDKIRLHFSLHYLESPVEVRGTVVWNNGEASGIRFDYC